MQYKRPRPILLESFDIWQEFITRWVSDIREFRLYLLEKWEWVLISSIHLAGRGLQP